MLSDAEIVAMFMEPKPTVNREMVEEFRQLEESKWWYWGWKYDGPSLPGKQTPVVYGWQHRRLTLDALHEVESRLTRAQCEDYNRILWDARETYTWHFSAESKIKALAAVLRESVEKEESK